MSRSEEQKKAIRAYKEREQIGGIYRVVNRKTGWQGPLSAAPDLEGKRSLLAFAKKTNSCFDPALQAQWASSDPEDFEFVEVERLKQKPGMTTLEFREDLRELLSLWQEKEG